MGNSAIPSGLGTTVTGALANIPFRFGIDSAGNYGYKKAGADTVTPFRNFDNVKYGIGTYSTSPSGAGVYIYTMPNGYDSSISMQSYSANSQALKTFDIFTLKYTVNYGYQITALEDIYVGNELVKKNNYKVWGFTVYRFYPIALAK